MSGPVSVIGTVQKNKRETLRVALDEYKGVQLIDVRVCVELTVSSGLLTPTGKGVSVNVALLPELRRLLTDAEAKARELGWIGGAP